MRSLGKIRVLFQGKEKTVELLQGDLTVVSPGEEMDILVVSAFPNDYTPTRTSLIGALDGVGISVETLAHDKAMDHRENYSCWLSQTLTSDRFVPGYKRILCFEPQTRGKPPAVVGDIFRALVAVLADTDLATVAMPIVAAGDQRNSVKEMLGPLVEAAINWMKRGLPVSHLKIVAYRDKEAAEAKQLFLQLQKRHNASPAAPQTSATSRNPEFDVLFSYAHEDDLSVQMMIRQLRRNQPKIRIFYDRLSIETGAAWQSKIFEAIDLCEMVVALLSPAYLASAVCKEEFGIAWLRGRNEGRNLLFPVYLHSANLPTYMQYRLYVDCREADDKKLAGACTGLLAGLEQVINPCV